MRRWAEWIADAATLVLIYGLICGVCLAVAVCAVWWPLEAITR